MANTTFTDLPDATGIDPAADWFGMDRTSQNETQRINRNTMLGITGSPVGTSDTQNLTNKTLDNTNTVTLKDTLFTLQDDGDTTKQAKFQLSGITTATTRTYTLPNASSTLADISTSQTFTNKTLTSPVITGGSIDNSTITVDSISGHTSANTGTIYGASIVSGVIASAALNNAVNTAAIQNSAVTTAKINDAAVTPAKLLAGTGSTWVWQTWTPTLTNLTLGNGTVNAYYSQTGKTISFRFEFTLGSSSAVGTSPTFSLPATAITTGLTVGRAQNQVFNASAYDSSATGGYTLTASLATSTTVTFSVVNTTFTYTANQGLTSTIPITWATGDILAAYGTYEAA